MGQRVPLRIYRVSQRASQYAAVLDKSSAYIQGLTDADVVKDISGKKSVYLTVENLPITGDEADFLQFRDGWYAVITDNDGVLQVQTAGSNIFKIRPSNIGTDSTIPVYFEFYVNPERVTPTYKKIITEIRTRGAWEVQHWGDNLTEVRIEGRTGGLHRNIDNAAKPGDYGQTLMPGQSITESTAWKRIMQLKSLYTSDHNVKNRDDGNLLGMNYYDRFFVGYFTDFTGPSADAQNPYIMTYGFTFKVQEEFSYDSFVKTLNPSEVSG
jgi:hypothetical protein